MTPEERKATFKATCALLMGRGRTGPARGADRLVEIEARALCDDDGNDWAAITVEQREQYIAAAKAEVE